MHEDLAGLLIVFLPCCHAAGEISCCHAACDILIVDEVPPRAHQTLPQLRFLMEAILDVLLHQRVPLSLHGLDLQQWLGQQHKRHADECEEQDGQLQLVLPAGALGSPHTATAIRLVGCLAHVQADVHHGGDDGWSPLAGRDIADFLIPHFQPLEDNEEVHVAEQDHHEHDLGQELKIEIYFLPEVQGVGCLEADAHHHVHHPDDHRQLHLKVVLKHQLVLGPPPDWV